MRRITTIVAAALLALPALGIAQEAEIKAGTEKFEAAWNAGDAAGVAAMYSMDAVLLPPNSPPVRGMKNIEALWAESVSMGGTADLTTDEVFVMGDMATEVGVYVINADDGSTVDNGHYMVVWKLEDGVWKMHRDMWNSDQSQM